MKKITTSNVRISGKKENLRIVDKVNDGSELSIGLYNRSISMVVIVFKKPIPPVVGRLCIPIAFGLQLVAGRV